MSRLTLSAGVALAIAAVTPASAEIVGSPLDWEVDGVRMQGYVAANANENVEPRGTVLIVHDWDGLTEYEMRRAEMLAALGYTAVAIDVYGRDRRPTSMDENRARSGELYADRDLFRARLAGAMEAAASHDAATEEMVIMGYCFGGAAALEAARAGMDLAGFVSFHGGLGTPEGQSYEGVEGPVLVLHGSADPVSGMADLAALLDEMQAAGVKHDAQVFGGARHSFTVYGSGDYDLDADRGSWEALQAFLAEQF